MDDLFLFFNYSLYITFLTTKTRWVYLSSYQYPVVVINEVAMVKEVAMYRWMKNNWSSIGAGSKRQRAKLRGFCSESFSCSAVSEETGKIWEPRLHPAITDDCTLHLFCYLEEWIRSFDSCTVNVLRCWSAKSVSNSLCVKQSGFQMC